MEGQNGEDCKFARRRIYFPKSDAWSSKNAELFTLTYGALVIQLIQDYEDYAEVNKQLEKM